MMREFFWAITTPIRRLKHIAAWLPVLWHDYDWDHAYLLSMIAFKLRRMQRYHETLGITDGRFRTARQLQICAILLERMRSNSYIDQDLEALREATAPGLDAIERLKRKISPEEAREYKRLFAKETMMYNQDLELFLTYFKKYHRSWWD